MARSLPQNVYKKSGRYYLVRRESGKRKWYALTKIDDGVAALYRSLSEHECAPEGTVAHLLERYLAEGTAQLAERTRKDYANSARRLSRVFGKMPVAIIEPTHIAQYLHASAKAGAPVQGNRDISVFRSAFQFGLRLGLARFDPCARVRRNTEKPRERYVNDDDFINALDRATPAFRFLLWAAYLTGMRQGDLRELRKSQLSDEGIVVRESKRGKRIVISWSPALRAICDEAAQAAPKSEFVFSNTDGKGWSLWAVQSAMRRLEVDWTFHDLRAKAESDHATGLGLLARYKRAQKLTPVG